MGLERVVVKETEYPSQMDWNLVTQWADIPLFKENDPRDPEWNETPVIKADLAKHGYGLVYIKNEAHKSNPTGTIKDRMAWELVTLYRDFAQDIVLENNERCINGDITDIAVPRLSVVTAGNIGRAVSHAFSKNGLPPVKLLVDTHLPQKRIDELKKLHADIYQTDLNKRKLTPKHIQALTNNHKGMEITSFMGIAPHEVFYDWHVHEVFNQQPDEVYVPYGSGRLLENYLYWQWRSRRNEVQKMHDPRLKAQASKVVSADIFGAEPVDPNSIADKLTKKYNPFVIFREPDIIGMKGFRTTGKLSGVYKIEEDRIKQAHAIMNTFCPAEPSAAAGLALYLHRYDLGLVNPRQKILVVNTGKGV